MSDPGSGPAGGKVSPPGAYIAGIEYELPAKILGNVELEAAYPNWLMAQVTRHTGVHERRIAAADETALDLGERAATRLLDRLRVDPSEIDALIFCTETPDHIMPPNSCLLQDRLGLRKTTAAFDFTLACSGFVYGLFLAHSLIAAGMKSVLLVTGDTYSKLIYPDDRGTRTLFGDGAAATLIRAGRSRIGPFDLGTDGSRSGCFVVPAGGARQPRSGETANVAIDRHGNRNTAEHIHMAGAEVLEFVKAEVPQSVHAVLARAEVTIADLDLVIFHQASQLSLDFLTRKLEIPAEKVFNNIALLGNTVSSSIPIALRDAEVQGRLNSRTRCLLVGFGVGVSWGACLVDGVGQ